MGSKTTRDVQGRSIPKIKQDETTTENIDETRGTIKEDRHRGKETIKRHKEGYSLNKQNKTQIINRNPTP